MTNIAIHEFTSVPRNKDVFANLWGLSDRAFGGTIRAADLTSGVSSDTKADLFVPNGFVPSGLVLGRYNTGANDGLYTPWVEDGSDGAEDIAGIVWDGFYLSGSYPGNYGFTENVTGSILLPNAEVYLVEAKMPGLLLANGSTANAVTAANIASTNWAFAPVVA